MTVQKRFGALLVGLSLVSSPVYADWQYTTWGMSPDEVVAASDGDAQQPEEVVDLGENVIHLLSAPYAVTDGQLKFQAQFFFRDSKFLDHVRLVPSVRDCNSVFRRLEETYGPGRESGGQVFAITKWFDRDNGNVVFFTEIQDTCRLDYSRFAVPGELGGL